MKPTLFLLLSLLLFSCADHDFTIPDVERNPIQNPDSGEDGDTDDPKDPENPENPDDPEKPDGPNNPVTDILQRYPLVEQGEGTLVADQTDTYLLIRAQGYNFEAPDESGSHASSPVRHVTQEWNEEIQRHVFAFHIHAAIDDDRGLANVRDRQRNEIKTDNKSPKSMVAQEGETLEMRWKFRLPEGFITTSKFCHIHQLKGIDNSEGTADVSLPMITFTPRSKSGGQVFQVIFVPPTEEGSGNQYLAEINLKELLGEWVTVTERVTFAQNGSYELSIVRLSDDKELIRVKDQGRTFWRTGTTGLRPKWGIYRSVGDDGSLRSSLRDEILLFADFEIEKL
uniref:hypothetical protein n=1 Tax=Alistipes sp. TaxID=1872444 RepID=UPI0040569C97